MITVLEIGGVSVDVVFKDIKNVHLSVYPPTGRVRISAPCHMDLESIRLFAISKLGWIKRHQAKLLSQERESPREYVERESHYLWGQRYLLQLDESERAPGVTVRHRHIVLHVEPMAPLSRRRAVLDDWYRRELRAAATPVVAHWERNLNLELKRLFIQRMKTKWGSSNPQKGSIRLNLELAKKPSECLNYIILHEMLHFIVPNHGARFVALLDEHLPGWRVIRQTVNQAPLIYDDLTQADQEPAEQTWGSTTRSSP
jgi:predicted metal-dependent hydrolase